MIDTYAGYIGFILAGVLILRLLYSFLPPKVIQFVPLILIIYISFMLLSSVNVISHNELLAQTYTGLLTWLPAMMIFLMLLQFRLDIFRKLGTKMMLTFFMTTLSIIISFVLVFYLFKPFLFEGANAYFSVLAGSWSGGTANMLAVASAIQLPEAHLGPIIAVDSILYAMWLMFLLALVPLSHHFNQYTQSTQAFDSLALDTDTQMSTAGSLWGIPLVLMIGGCITYGIVTLVDGLSQADFLRDTFITPSFLTILLATLVGVIASFTPLRRLAYSHTIAQFLLYCIVALIASKVAYTESTHFEFFFFLAGLILLLHALFMVTLAKFFKLDLFSIAIASLSHIGGVASAPILASAYHRNLIPMGVAMATAGYLLGTVVGLFIAYLLGAL